MRISLEDLTPKLSDPAFRQGCLVDTSVLFAASYPVDRLNTWAENVFETLHRHSIPIHTNINIRSEFIDLHRRVLIPEGLVTMLGDLSGQLEPAVEQQLKILKTQVDRATKDGKATKFHDQQIKKYRDLLGRGWDLFCDSYLEPYIKDVWETAVRELKITFVGTRKIDDPKLFEQSVEWPKMLEIVGKTGVGSSDAMIINLFLSSKFQFIVSADSDFAAAVERFADKSRFVLAPN